VYFLKKGPKTKTKTKTNQAESEKQKQKATDRLPSSLLFFFL
jgi:hypothetical protein